MAVKITHISPKTSPLPADRIVAHVNLNFFRWIDETDKQIGETSRANMFDWITNKKGRAYVIVEGEEVFIFGAVSPSGVQYIRALKDGKWTDDLLQLPEFNEKG